MQPLLKVKGWKRYTMLRLILKKRKLAVFISDKVDLRTKNVTRVKKDFIMTMRSVHQEDVIILNIHTPIRELQNTQRTNRTVRRYFQIHECS